MATMDCGDGVGCDEDGGDGDGDGKWKMDGLAMNEWVSERRNWEDVDGREKDALAFFCEK